MKIQKSQLKSSLLRKLAITPAFIVALISSFTAYSQVSIITERLRNDLINPSKTTELLTSVNLSNSSGNENVKDNEITGFLETLKADGSWGDINYSQTVNWQALTHLRRLQAICIAYNKPTSIYYHKKDIKNRIRGSIEFYIHAKPKSSGWWQNAIGAPIVIGPILILMKTGDSFGLEQPLLDSYAGELLLYYTESALKWPASTTGGNKTWLLRSSVYKACIQNNEAVLSSDFECAFEEIRVIDGAGEGIKADNSFYQHGPQLYSAGYGRDFLLDITYYGVLANGTTYQISDSQLKFLTSYVLEGYQWFSQKKAFDFISVGRELVRPGALTTESMKIIIDRLKAMNAPSTLELSKCYDFVDGKSGFQSPGNKHFWKSDIMVHHGENFYLSARVPSFRVIGTEKVSGENLKRKYLPWGVTNIMVEGDEYWNIFPAWDWARIPGVTSVKEVVEREDPKANGSTVNTTLSADLVSSAEFAGGVSDGVFGLAAYDYSRDGITARKAYFFTPAAMYCIGAEITASKTNPVITNVNQCNSSGTVTVSADGVKSTVDGVEKTFSNPAWSHHNKVGYIFPVGGEITVKNMEQTGTWGDIRSTPSTTPVTVKVFSLWIDHGNTPSGGKYEYIVVPSQDLVQFEKWVAINPLKSVLNTGNFQAVRDISSGVFGIAFYRAGTVALETGLAVTASRACLMLIQTVSSGPGYKITVSDPTATVQNLIVKISKKLTGAGAIVNPDQSSSIIITLPSGELAGKSVSREFIYEPTAGSMGFENFKLGPLPFYY